jgi:vacuolar-type H+-ATPase subunit E/Vma4
MSLEAILAKIEEDAAREAEEIVRSAADEKEEALRRSGTRLEEQQARDMKKLELEMDDLRNRLEEHARRETRRKLQNRRRKLIDGAIDQAVSALASADADRYREMVGKVIGRCSAEGRIEVVISRGDGDRITPSFLESCSDDRRQFVLSEDGFHEHTGGVILVSDRISYNGTFSMIAKLAHENMVMKLSSIVPLE